MPTRAFGIAKKTGQRARRKFGVRQPVARRFTANSGAASAIRAQSDDPHEPMSDLFAAGSLHPSACNASGRDVASVHRCALACKDTLTCRRSAQARKNAMAPTARSAPLEKIERLAETRERQIPCSVWASAWAPKTKKMRLLEIRRAHPVSQRVSLFLQVPSRTPLFKWICDRS